MDEFERREFYLRAARVQIDIALGQIRLQRAFQKSARALKDFDMAVAAAELACADQGEFDNRAHDWLRAE